MTLIRLLLLKWIMYGENLWRGQTGAKENISRSAIIITEREWGG